MFRQKKTTIEDALDKAIVSMREYLEATEDGCDHSQVVVVEKGRWMPPTAGTYKVNSNATFFVDGKVRCGGDYA